MRFRAASNRDNPMSISAGRTTYQDIALQSDDWSPLVYVYLVSRPSELISVILSS
jgi:hypothetical protein